MGGTREGGLKARDKNIANNPDFYKVIGATGGSVTGVKKGFALSGKAEEAGAKGGKISRRGAVVKVVWGGEETNLSKVAKAVDMPYRKVYQYYKTGRLHELQEV